MTLSKVIRLHLARIKYINWENMFKATMSAVSTRHKRSRRAFSIQNCILSKLSNTLNVTEVLLFEGWTYEGWCKGIYKQKYAVTFGCNSSCRSYSTLLDEWVITFAEILIDLFIWRYQCEAKKDLLNLNKSILPLRHTLLIDFAVI